MKFAIWGYFLIFFLFNGYSEDSSELLLLDFPWQDSIAELKQKNIHDYFLLLPSNFLDCENIKEGYSSIQKRETLCNVIDIKNGYIQFLKVAEMALFKNRSDSIDIIAVQIGKCGAGATCGAVNEIMQFLPKEKKWKFKKDLLPTGYTYKELYEKYIDDDICPYFKLPQKGLVIKIVDENQEKDMFQMKWNGEKFFLLTKHPCPLK